MALTIQKMAANTAEATFTYGTDEVHILYLPGMLNNRVIGQLDQGLEEMDLALTQVIKAWDVYEDEAQTLPFPLIPERMGELPFDFRVLVAQAIVMDARPELSAPQKIKHQAMK